MAMTLPVLPKTNERVARHTSEQVNRAIQEKTEHNIGYFAEHPDEINRRLDQLDREWDIERTLEANAATLMLTGVTLGTTVDRRWFILPVVVGGFLLQHALQGWCPPVPVLRRIGFRTEAEIDAERYALKALRGDFSRISPVMRPRPVDPAEVLEAVQG